MGPSTTIFLCAVLFCSDPTKLIKDLDDDSFTVREAATVRLISLGDSILPKVVLVLKDNKISLEQRRRLERVHQGILEQHRQRLLKELDDFEAKLGGKYPFVDSAWYNVDKDTYWYPGDQTIPWVTKMLYQCGNPYLNKRYDGVDKPPDEKLDCRWWNYRQATRRLTYDLLSKGVKSSTLEPFYRVMLEKDEIWLGRRDGHWPIPNPEPIPLPRGP